jgi:glycosyltransferase involved in cell wall biosynthesis
MAGPGIVFTYNAEAHQRNMGLYERKRGGKWIAVIADVANWSDLGRAEQCADGVVYLSWELYDRSLVKHKFHLDGGIDRVNAEGRLEPLAPPAALYSGSLDGYSGINNLIEAWKLLDEGVELWITGQGDAAHIKRICGAIPGIRVYGLVDEQTLLTLGRRASFFINPRSQNFAGNIANFPSKLLDYLSWCKPVVTTWTPGLSPAYRKVTFVAKSDAPADIAREIRRVIDLGEDARHDYAISVKDWLVSNKLWSRQAGALIEWLRKTRLINDNADGTSC